MLWIALVMAGCTGSGRDTAAGNVPDSSGFACSTRFGDEVSYDDSSAIGASGNDAIAWLDDTDWSVSWTTDGLGEHAILPAGPSSIRLSIDPEEDDLVTVLTITEGVEDGCDEDPGTYLWVPVTIAVGSDGDISARGAGYLTVGSIDEASIWVSPAPFALGLSPPPDDIQKAGDGWSDSIGKDAPKYYAYFSGPMEAAALRIFAHAEWYDANGDAQWEAEELARGLLQR